MVIKRKNCFCLGIAILTIVITLFFIPINFLGAVSKTNQFDETEVLSDLRSAENFNINDFPFDSSGLLKHPEVMNVVEYCYSFKVNKQGNYGLYLYFYNPQCLNIETNSKANKVQLATAYVKNSDGDLIPSKYEKFDLKFCSVSTEPNYYRLFYKFKVIDRKGEDGKTIVERLNSNARRYDISGIELAMKGQVNAVEYTVGGTYIFTGYAKGYGADANAESNLNCTVRDLETVRLDVAGKDDGIDKRTYWRSNSSSLGAHHQNQINSVYFGIDKTVLKTYGYMLQKIKAEWYEYKTRPAIVVDRLDVYNGLSPYVGKDIGEEYNSSRGYSLGYYKSVNPGSNIYGWSWNAELVKSGVNVTLSEDIESILPLLFYTNGVKVDDYVLSSKTLESYINNYTKSYHKGHLTFNNHDYSMDLFDDTVDNGRTKGYNLREFDIGDPQDYWNIKSYDDTHSWWNKLWDYGFGSIKTDDDYRDVPPIQMITAEDMAVKDLSTHLKINPDDVENFKKFYNRVKDKQEVFIFRYALTDYYAVDLNIYDIANKIGYNAGIGVYDKHIAELRQGTQFFDFDILEFTFNKEGVYTVIPVVSSPVDHISGYTPSVEAKHTNWVLLILILIGLVILLIILAPVLPYIIRFVIWLVCLPFRAIAAIVQAFKGRKRNTEKHKKRE